MEARIPRAGATRLFAYRIHSYANSSYSAIYSSVPS